MPRKIAGFYVEILGIPAVFHTSIRAVMDRAEETCADRFLMAGQAGGRFEH